jgi:hypothetical protein
MKFVEFAYAGSVPIGECADSLKSACRSLFHKLFWTSRTIDAVGDVNARGNAGARLEISVDNALVTRPGASERILQRTVLRIL